jgi:hypothetical protein
MRSRELAGQRAWEAQPLGCQESLVHPGSAGDRDRTWVHMESPYGEGLCP